MDGSKLKKRRLMSIELSVTNLLLLSTRQGNIIVTLSDSFLRLAAKTHGKLQALVYDIIPLTTAILTVLIHYTIGQSRKTAVS